MQNIMQIQTLLCIVLIYKQKNRYTNIKILFDNVITNNW